MILSEEREGIFQGAHYGGVCRARGLMKQDSSGFFKPHAGVGDVMTTSSFRAWWLTWRGYRVESVIQLPKVGSFGRVTYYRRWLMVPKAKKQ